MLRSYISNFLRRSLGFRNACLASIVLHVAFLFLLAIVLGLLDVKNLYTPPLVFDFVFAPAQDYDKAGPSLEDWTKSAKHLEEPQEVEPAKSESADSRREFETRRPRKDETPPAPAISEQLPADLEDELASRVKEIEHPNPDDPLNSETNQPADLPKAKTIEEPDWRHAITAVKPTSLDFKKWKSRQPNLVSAMVSMTPRQHKMLRKKFKKWTENLHRMDLADSSIVWKHKGKMYSARVRSVGAKSETDIEEVVIEVNTEEKGYTLSSEMRMQRLAFSNFAQFVDYWDPRVAVHDDILIGRFHTNTTFNVSQSYGIAPKFEGRVTTSSYEVRSSGTLGFLDEETIFVGGLETGVKEIRLPKIGLPFANDIALSERNAQVFPDETWITFRGDGSFAWKTASAHDTVLRRDLPNESFYIIGNKKKKLHLKGVVRGKVLVYSPGKIIISGDLVYARHPEIARDANDYLGLVSDKDIEIGHPSVTGSGDLTIHASIYAKGRFRVTHLHRKSDATLYVYGSLTAGSLSATEPRYATNIRFDKRFATRRPPNFPMTDRYEIKEWDGRWRLKPN